MVKYVFWFDFGLNRLALLITIVRFSMPSLFTLFTLFGIYVCTLFPVTICDLLLIMEKQLSKKYKRTIDYDTIVVTLQIFCYINRKMETSLVNGNFNHWYTQMTIKREQVFHCLSLKMEEYVVKWEHLTGMEY